MYPYKYEDEYITVQMNDYCKDKFVANTQTSTQMTPFINVYDGTDSVFQIDPHFVITDAAIGNCEIEYKCT